MDWQPIESRDKEDGRWFVGSDGAAVYPCVRDLESEIWVAAIDLHFVRGVLPTKWQHPGNRIMYLVKEGGHNGGRNNVR